MNQAETAEDMDAPAAGVGEGVYQKIKSDIVFGRLKPAEKLKLPGLRDRYGVSITTLRETLNRLSSEGLVVAEGQRGFHVAPISIANLQEIAALRKLIEGHAMRLSFAAGDLNWEGRVVAAHHKLALLEKQMQAGDDSKMQEWRAYDLEFHKALASACGSHELMDLHAAYYEKYLRYQMVYRVLGYPVVPLVVRGKVAASEHEKMFQCALARDADGAIAVLNEHIDGSVRQTIKAVGSGPKPPN